jgi:hypothetical protein
VLFFRSMGNAVGATLLGAVLTATLKPLLAAPGVQALLVKLPKGDSGALGDRALGPVNALFDLAVREVLPLDLRAVLAAALSNSLGWVFGAVLLMAVAGAALALPFPRVTREPIE